MILQRALIVLGLTFLVISAIWSQLSTILLALGKSAHIFRVQIFSP